MHPDWSHNSRTRMNICSQSCITTADASCLISDHTTSEWADTAYPTHNSRYILSDHTKAEWAAEAYLITQQQMHHVWSHNSRMNSCSLSYHTTAGTSCLISDHTKAEWAAAACLITQQQIHHVWSVITQQQNEQIQPILSDNSRYRYSLSDHTTTEGADTAYGIPNLPH